MLLRWMKTVCCVLPLLLMVQGASAGKKSKKKAYSEPVVVTKPYLFGWPDFEGAKIELRGGTSTGGPVELVTEPGTGWTNLQDPSLEGVARDQMAIRALAGDYKVTFDFLETMVFGEASGPAKPYRSWATERVYIIGDEPGFVSLQHILVMYYVDDKGVTQGPMVIKHWRQDWTYEPAEMVEYAGHRHFQKRALGEEERTGQWSQTVYQVDDTLRYSLLGGWEHNETYSAWTSDKGWRPLPRREYSVRDDYHVLDGMNRITIMEKGWVHEQDNLKRVLPSEEGQTPSPSVLAREIGINRYLQMKDFDFSAGDAYWEKTSTYWALVREEWAARVVANDKLRVDTKCGEESVFMLLFGLAGKVESGELTEAAELKKQVNEVFDCIVSVPE